MNPLMLETALSERDVAALHEWQEQQRQNVAELEAALDFERSEVARLMNLLIEAQANGNHLRRALEWLATECKLLIEPRVHSVEQIVVSALAITEEAQSA